MTSSESIIPVFKPLIEREELDAVHESLARGWLGMGADVGAFERALAEFIGAPDRHLAAVSTGHAALHLALMLADIGAGDEVITASFNNVADFQAILAIGASPVFCDVDDRTLCIDPARIEELVSSRTRAIIAMDYACHLCEHDAIAAIAERNGLRIVHDAAHSFGSRFRDRPVGSFSDITVFSFDPVKTITAIDGGAIVMRSEDELARVREMRLIGMSQPVSVMYQNERSWTYDVKQLGFRYHLANAHGAVGLAQLRKLDRIAKSRRDAFAYYVEQLGDVEAIVTPQCDIASVVPFIFYVRVRDGRRDGLRAHLRDRGIDSGIHWRPGHSFTLFREVRRGNLDVTDRIGKEILTLPFHSAMDRAMQDRVIGALRSFR